MKAIRTPVNGNRKATTLKLADLVAKHSVRDLMVWLELSVTGQKKSTNLVTFARPKHLELAAKPGITTQVSAGKDGGFTVTLKTKQVAMWVWLELDGVDAKCSDNFLHLRPGRTLTLTVTPARKLSSGELRKRLRVRSLVDTY